VVLDGEDVVVLLHHLGGVVGGVEGVGGLEFELGVGVAEVDDAPLEAETGPLVDGLFEDATVEAADGGGADEEDDAHGVVMVVADYVFGRMMKLGFTWTAGTILVPDSDCKLDYQAWCGRYPTYRALIEAAITSL